jgi:hypothetical protein
MKELTAPTNSLPPPTKRGLFGGTLLEIYHWSEAVRSGRIKIDPSDVKLMHRCLCAQMRGVNEFIAEWRDKIPKDDPRRDRFSEAMEMQMFSMCQLDILEHELTVSRQRNADLEREWMRLTMENKELKRLNDELIKGI